jgi:hypothetical protein
MSCTSGNPHGYVCACHPQTAHCGCGGRPYPGHCFPTREQRIAHLERYLENLQEAAKHVEACLATTRGEE